MNLVAYEGIKGFQEILENCGNLTEFDDVLEQVESGEMWIGTAYSGDAAALARDAPQVGYVIPEEGSMRWTDLFAITRHARHPQNAHRFISFLLEPENAAQNANAMAYPTIVEAAESLLAPEIREDPCLTLSAEMRAKCPPYHKLGPDLVDIQTELRRLASLKKEALAAEGQSEAD